MEHPRWGMIHSARALRNIQSGEELLAHYGYKKEPFPLDRPWYWEAKAKLNNKANTVITDMQNE